MRFLVRIVEQTIGVHTTQVVEAVAVSDLCKSVASGVMTGVPQWLLDRMHAGTLLVGQTSARLELPDNLEGAAGWNDWIVRFEDGTIIPMRADLFFAVFGVHAREHAA